MRCPDVRQSGIRHRARRRPARGATLILMLAVVAALAVLALGAMGSDILQQRMLAHARDREVALQAAEAALRDAEADIEANIDAASVFDDACTDGLCTTLSDLAINPHSAPRASVIDWDASTRRYGSRTGAPPLPGPGNTALAAQPRYFIERLPSLPAPRGTSACVGGGCSNGPVERGRGYRVTARASGVRPTTLVILQSVYVKQ